MQKALFTGDLVFKKGLGRTDLPGGDGTLIKESIKRMSLLDIELLLSGHGEIISGANEVKSNFYTFCVAKTSLFYSSQTYPHV